MSHNRIPVGIAWAVAILVARPAHAQVDHRVNAGNVHGSGQALDSNPGLYTGRLNPSANTFDGGLRADALITGNMTGLGRFHDSTPIVHSNQFRDTLPSAGLSNFQAMSVGIGDIRSRYVPTPTLYYGSQEFVSDVGVIRQGLNAPGSSRLASPYVPLTRPAAPSTLSITDARAFLNVPFSGERDSTWSSDLQPLGVIRQEVRTPDDPLAEAIRAMQPSYEAATSSSIFGAPRPAEPILDADVLRRSNLLRKMENARDDERKASDREAILRRWESEQRASDALLVDKNAAAQSGAAGKSSYGIQQLDPGQTALKTQPQAEPADGFRRTDESTSQLGSLGADRFADLYRAIQIVDQLGIRNLGFKLTDQPTGEAAEAAPGTSPPTQTGTPVGHAESAPKQRMTRQEAKQLSATLANATRWAGETLENPITSFAGRYDDRLNQAMAAGEAALRGGKYYEAVRYFDVACTIDPGNPLPMLHRGHALVAAGDYVSASLSLQRGIERFPQIAAFRLDLPAMAGKSTIFDIRRADLEKKIAIADHYEMRFLLGYLELYSGLPELGLKDLQRAADMAPQDSVVRLFNDLILGRRELPPLPSMR